MIPEEDLTVRKAELARLEAEHEAYLIENQHHMAESLKLKRSLERKPVIRGFDSLGKLIGYASDTALSLVVKSNHKIRKPPGTRVQGVLMFLYSKKAFDNIFSQIIKDMRDEYNEALSVGHVWHARWIHFRGLMATLTTMLLHTVTSCGKVVAKIWKMTP